MNLILKEVTYVNSSCKTLKICQNQTVPKNPQSTVCGNLMHGLRKEGKGPRAVMIHGVPVKTYNALQNHIIVLIILLPGTHNSTMYDEL